MHVAYTDHLPDMHHVHAPTGERVGDKYEMDRL
jgi:hypothetical protein